eukprot:10896166-Alexandrium_andersonii.AAC.1
MGSPGRGGGVGELVPYVCRWWGARAPLRGRSCFCIARPAWVRLRRAAVVDAHACPCVRA